MTVEAMEELRKLWTEVRPKDNIVIKVAPEKETVLVQDRQNGVICGYVFTG